MEPLYDVESAKTLRLSFSASILIGPIGVLPRSPLSKPPASTTTSPVFAPSSCASTSCASCPAPFLPSPATMNADDGDDRSSSTPTGASKSVSGQDKDKPRLTDQEKKNNHIASEQKRRAAIREGFDRLTELVPGLEGQGRSESIVLQKTVDFMHLKLQERQNLIAEIESKGGRVDDSLRPQ